MSKNIRNLLCWCFLFCECDHISCVVLGVMQGMWLWWYLSQPVCLITISSDCLSSQASCQSNIWIPSTHSHACYCFRISIFSQISILSEKGKNSPSSKRKSRHSGKKLIMCVWWLEECQGICRQCRPSDHQGLCQSPSDSRSLHDPAPCM